jgi:hypothetical protein
MRKSPRRVLVHTTRGFVRWRSAFELVRIMLSLDISPSIFPLSFGSDAGFRLPGLSMMASDPIILCQRSNSADTCFRRRLVRSIHLRKSRPASAGRQYGLPNEREIGKLLTRPQPFRAPARVAVVRLSHDTSVFVHHYDNGRWHSSLCIVVVFGRKGHRR